MPKPKRKLQVFDEYQVSPRQTLKPGDRFRVAGGPMYRSGEGALLILAKRGVLIFQRYCVEGSRKWIEAIHEKHGRQVSLYVGRVSRKSPIPGVTRRPYRVTKVLKPKTASMSKRKCPPPQSDN